MEYTKAESQEWNKEMTANTSLKTKTTLEGLCFVLKLQARSRPIMGAIFKILEMMMIAAVVVLLLSSQGSQEYVPFCIILAWLSVSSSIMRRSYYVMTSIRCYHIRSADDHYASEIMAAYLGTFGSQLPFRWDDLSLHHQALLLEHVISVYPHLREKPLDYVAGTLMGNVSVFSET